MGTTATRPGNSPAVEFPGSESFPEGEGVAEGALVPWGRHLDHLHGAVVGESPGSDIADSNHLCSSIITGKNVLNRALYRQT